MAITPASIRYRNPGAQYPGSVSKRYGSRRFEVIGGGHKIAVFPTMVDGAAALFGLLWKGYRGRTVRKAIEKWSGGHSVNSYLKVIEQHTPFDRYDYIDDDFLKDPVGAIEFAKAMARHETGRDYPMTDEQWSDAHDVFMGREFYREPVKPSGNDDREDTTPLEYALTQLGTKEVQGGENPEIIQYFIDVGREDILEDEVPWCAAFVGAVLKRTGHYYLEDNLLAREYLKYGVSLAEPEVGAIIVMRRGNSSWQGHVAFIEEVTPNVIKYVGGNQSDSVTRASIQRNSDKILGYQRPIPLKRPIKEIAKTKSVRYKSVGLLGVLSALIYDSWSSLVAGLAFGIDFLGVAIGALPDVALEAKKAASAGETITQSAGLPWPVTAGIAIVGISIAFNLWNTYKRKRARKDDD